MTPHHYKAVLRYTLVQRANKEKVTTLERYTAYTSTIPFPVLVYVYASSSARSLALAFVTRIANCSARSMISRLPLVDTDFPTVAA